MLKIGDEKPVIQIPGVDVETGLALYNGEEDVFISVLRSYASNALSVIDKMRYVSEETLSDYAINAHGLKGISAGIGAEKVRTAAYDLEIIAKSGDFKSVISANKTLIKETESLVSGIQAWLSELDGQRPKLRLYCPDRFLLDRLQKSCEAYDMRSIDEVMDELESASYDNGGDLVVWLREKIDASDFSSAAERLSEYGEKAE